MIEKFRMRDKDMLLSIKKLPHNRNSTSLFWMMLLLCTWSLLNDPIAANSPSYHNAHEPQTKKAPDIAKTFRHNIHHAEDEKGVHPAQRTFLLTHNKQPDTLIVLLHGYTANPNITRPLAQHLFEEGYDVLGMRLEGHGTSPEDLAKTGWDNWLKSGLIGYFYGKKHYNKTILFGASSGALVALYIASKFPVDGIITEAPFLFAKDKRFAALPLIELGRDLLGLSLGAIDVDVQPRNKGLHYAKNPYASLIELYHFQKLVRRQLPAIQAPLLVLHSPKDSVADPKSATYLYRQVASTDKTLHWRGNEHMFLYHGDKEGYALIAKFCNRL